MDFNQDFFTLFQLPRRFALDRTALDAAYRRIQGEVHPDRFAASPEAERRLALQWATRANEAHQTLRQPLARARYLLALAGVDTAEDTNTAMPAEFLMLQMEWREAMMDARAARDADALETLIREVRADARALEAELAAAQNLSIGDRERLFGYLENKGKVILVEPQALLTEASRMPGLDGQKMSKSYGNGIFLREDPAAVTKKVRGMPTDPARVRRTDPGSPDKCPVWQLHQVYTDRDTHDWVQSGCRSAGIGCLECKQPVIDGILAEQQPMFERAQQYLDDPTLVKSIVADGCERARAIAQETMRDVREAMGLGYA